ncbi:hypothetical protein [Grimontia sp. NTOU-MAR1]|uniref:hypothetical protein n=1 Tax=Grimontia sp. NTOU-MAR1 TaxID=3111011 RepID=UPI002DBEBDBB|nr:hypothetical protein [Grimontia sp. NTOU-MAR1]WRV98267.1 hypothetical protein VP504_02180 [Grimontia sp. NTOU-MAR1]
MDNELHDVRADLKLLAPAAVALDGGEPLPTDAPQSDTGEGMEFDAVPAEPMAADPVLKGTIATLTTVLSALVCPNWKIQPEEVDAIAESGTVCLQHYFPDANLDHPAVGFGLVVAGVAGSRLAMGIPPKEKPPETQQDALPDDTASAVHNPDNALQEGVLHEQ